MQPNVSGQDTGMQDEAGAQDNRLSLSPSDPKWSDFVGSWKDGQKYSLTVDVRQISPGEFEVIDAKETEGTAEADDNAAEDTAESPAAKAGGYSNPAIDGMMNEA